MADEEEGKDEMRARGSDVRGGLRGLLFARVCSVHCRPFRKPLYHPIYQSHHLGKFSAYIR